MRIPVNVTVSMKSAASRALACERRKSAQVVVVRSGAGSAAPLGTGDGRVAAGDQVAMPAQDRVGACQQPQAP